MPLIRQEPTQAWCDGFRAYHARRPQLSWASGRLGLPIQENVMNPNDEMEQVLS